MNDIKTITIWSQRLAGFLMFNGFVLADMRQDYHDSKRNVFFFKNSKEIVEKINEYKNLK